MIDYNHLWYSVRVVYSIGCTADLAMQDVFGAKYVSLHVRVTNKGAHHLYTKSLGYKCAACPKCLRPSD